MTTQTQTKRVAPWEGTNVHNRNIPGVINNGMFVRDGYSEAWRVCWVINTSAPGCHGWKYVTRTFETEAEAMEVALRPMTGICRSVAVDYLKWDYATRKHVGPSKSSYTRKNIGPRKAGK